MKVKFTARRFTLTDDVKARVEKKLSKLDKFFPADTEAAVKLTTQNSDERIEITVICKGVLFRAEESAKDYACALDSALDSLERQIRKNRTRLEKRRVYDKNVFDDISYDEPEDDIRITKVKRFTMIPMSPEEAVMQMNLSGHTFFVFRNADTDSINVVYKRSEEDYGIIEPAD